MMCVSALLRRFNAEVYLCSEGEAKVQQYKHLIVREKASKEFEDCKARDVAAYGLDSDACMFYRKSTKLVDRDEYMESTIPDFILHHQKQQIFMDEINSVFPPEITRKSFHQAFYDDIIYPNWPKTQELPKEMYAVITWQEKFLRLFCVYDKNKMAFAQGAFQSAPTTNFYLNALSVTGLSFYLWDIFSKIFEPKISTTTKKKIKASTIRKHRETKGVGFCSSKLDLGPFHIIVKDVPSTVERDSQELAIKAYLEVYPDHELVGREVDLFIDGKVITSLDLLFLDKSQTILTIVEAKHKGITAVQLQALQRYIILLNKVPYGLNACHFTPDKGLFQSC
jgi:hypothetical protein